MEDNFAEFTQDCPDIMFLATNSDKTAIVYHKSFNLVDNDMLFSKLNS